MGAATPYYICIDTILYMYRRRSSDGHIIYNKHMDAMRRPLTGEATAPFVIFNDPFRAKCKR